MKKLFLVVGVSLLPPTVGLKAEEIKDTVIKQIQRGTDEKAVFSCVPDLDKIKISAAGQVKIQTANKNQAVFRLPLTKGNQLEKLFCFEADDFFVVAYSDTDGETAGTQITRISKNTMKPEWVYTINALGWSGAAIDKEGFYYAGSSTVGKIDLSTGKAVWTSKVKGWYEPVDLSPTAITFQAVGGGDKKVKLDRVTGKQTS